MEQQNLIKKYMLQLTNFSKNFRDKVLFEKISFRFHENKIYYIYGNNGIGKTTLFRCMLEIDNYDGEIKKNSNNQFCIFDNTPFYTDLTGIDNLIIFSQDLYIEQKILKIETEYLSIDFLHKIKVKNYSLGEKKILSLLLLRVLNPKIILLDEVLNGLDQNNRKLLFHTLDILRENALIIMSGHEKLYIDLCDELLMIKDMNIEKIEKEEIEYLFTI